MRVRVVIVFLFTLSASLSSAQILYNQRLDKQSEDALAATKAAVSNVVFDKETQNLDVLLKSSTDRIFTSADLQMSSDLSGFYSWHQISGIIDRVTKDAGTATALTAQEQQELASSIEHLKSVEKDTKTALNDFKISAAAAGKNFPQISEWLDRLGDVKALQGYATSVPALTPSANTQALVNELSNTFTSLATLYKNFTVSLPASPDMVVLQAQLALAKSGEEHLVQLGLVNARLILDLQTLQGLVTLATATRNCVISGNGSYTVSNTSVPCIKATTDDVGLTITETVDSYKRARNAFLGSSTTLNNNAQISAKNQLDVTLSLVALGAALAARGNIAQRLAFLREADENQRYTIKQSMLSAQSYAQLLVTGSQRLSLYYKGGIHPDTLAQMMTALGTLGLIPTVLAK